jgi:hypothetical protein
MLFVWGSGSEHKNQCETYGNEQMSDKNEHSQPYLKVELYYKMHYTNLIYIYEIKFFTN